MTRTIDAVCFDLDDTLYDYHQYARRGLEAAADYMEAQTGERYHDELLELYFEEGRTEGTFDRLVEREDLPAELIEELVEAFHDSSGPLAPDPDAEPVLSELADECWLGLVTDGRNGHDKLRRLGLDSYFDAVVVTPRSDRTKADPAVFVDVCSELSVPPRSVVYVGDDPRVDFRVPNDLGMGTVRLRRGRYVSLDPPEDRDRPDHEILSLDALPKRIAALDGSKGRLERPRSGSEHD